MDEKLKSEYIRHNLISVGILLGILLIGIIGYKLITAEKEPDYESWSDAEFGDIVVSNDTKESEILPENIFDGYGLEYEYQKLPSVGISTYAPLGWGASYDKDFFYFMSPDNDEKLPYVEIAICVMDIGSINNSSDRIYAQQYMQENIRNHNTMELAAKLVTNNDYVAVKNGGELFAYYVTPNIEFRREDDASKGGWNPYCVIYMLNTDSDITTFCCVSGPKNYVQEIDEIAKTVAYNTEKYTNTEFDFSELVNVKMDRKKNGKIQYLVKDVKAIEGENPVATIPLANGYGTEVYPLSADINSLAYNAKLVVQTGYFDGKTLDDYVDESFMESMYMNVSDQYSENRSVMERKLLEKPDFSVDSCEKVQVAGRDARKVEWRVSTSGISTGRNKLDALMPKMFTTYVFQDGNVAYSFTLNYTKYQKYAAKEYLEKTMETVAIVDE